MMRRVSKREMLHRLDSVPYARVHLDSLRSSSARVTLEGVICEVNFPRKARDELMRASGIYGNLASIPAAIGDGYLPPGTKLADYPRAYRRTKVALPTITIFDSYSQERELQFERFQKRHPIGAIISGRVILVNRRVAILDLGLGQQGRLDCGKSLDYTFGRPIKWLPLPSVGQVLDVLIRRFNQSMCVVDLSFHTFRQDTKYCNFSAGYRRNLSTELAGFQKLPWSK